MTEWAQLADCISRDDAAGIVRLCAGLSEVERRPLGQEASALYRADWRNIAAGLAVLATGTRSDADRLWGPLLGLQPNACVAILADRRPAWLDGWLTARLEHEQNWSAFVVARRLRQLGLYAGDSPAYALAFIGASNSAALQHGTPLDEVLRQDRSLLDDELWRAFRIEGGGQTSFAAHDKYAGPTRSWSVALRRLADDGVIDRQRLVDATLDALARGYSAFRAGWFVRLHDALDLTPEEQRLRCDHYVDLLGSPTPQVQSFAVKAVAALDRIAPLPDSRLINALRPVVLHPAKATAAQALRLVDVAARRSRGTEVKGLAARVAATALVHEAPDVQALALAIVDGHAQRGDADLTRAVEAAAPLIAASVRTRLGLFLHTEMPVSSEAVVATEEVMNWPDDILDAHVLDAIRVVSPVESLAELALSVARALEHPEETETVEQALDGISRLCGDSHSAPVAMWTPLRRRAVKLHRSSVVFRGWGLAADLPAVVLAWLSGELPAPLEHELPKTALGFLSARLHALAVSAGSSQARQLLSAPTHAGGWINPEILVARLATEPDPTDRADLILALLRLAPERRAPALETARLLPLSEATAALRFALGSAPERANGAREVWVAAERARSPGGAATQVDADFFEGLGAEADVRWCAMLQPSDLDPLFTAGVSRIGNNLDWWQAQWADRAYLEPLLEVPYRFSETAVRLVTLGLATKEPGIRGLAAEVTARALADGRLPVEAFGASLGEWWASPLVTPRRFAQSLANAAAASATTRARVRHAMTIALHGPPHADAVPLLELIHELAHADGVGIPDPAARATLGGYARGQATRLARRLLAL